MQYMRADLRGYLSIFENIRCNSVLKPLALSPLRRAHKWLKLRMFLKIYFRGYLSIFENIRCNSVLKPLALSPLRRGHKWLKFLNVLVSKEIKWSSHEIKTSYHEKRLHDFYSRVVMHQKTQSFSALTRSFFYASLLVNKNRSCAPSMK